jgi:hypothetical protein
MVGETSAGKLVVEIVGDVSGLIAAYDAAKKQTDGLTAKLTQIGDRMTAIGKDLTLKVSLPIALMGAGMVKVAGDAEELQSKFKQVFGTMSDDVEAWADTYGNAAGRATTDLQDMLATTGSIVKAMDMVGEEGAEFSETITQLAVDMGSFHNASDIEAFNALRSAITGEYEPMKRFGVIINEAKVEQELLTMGIAGGTKAATDAEKAQARLNIIMGATADAQGDAVRTAGSFSNQMKALTADAKEFGEEIGRELLPMAQGLIAAGREVIGKLSELDSGTKTAIVGAGLFAAAVGPATWALGSMAGGIGQIINLYKVYQASTLAATIATKGFTTAILANPVGLAIVGVATLAAVLLTLKMSTDEATEAAKAHAAALFDTEEMVAKSTEELTAYIDGQRMTADALREEIRELENTKRGLDKGTVSRRSNARAMGEGYLAAQDLTAALNKNAGALSDVENFTLDVAIATKKHELSMTDASIAAADYVRKLKGVASAAQTELRRADQAYRDHQKSVSDLQKEYDALSKTIDKALGIDREMQDADRDVERADIRRIRAHQDLADLDDEIAAKERELQAGNYQSINEREDAEQELADLKLRHRGAVLDLADAETSYTDALEESARVKEEKTQLEKDLNGESVESAQGRLGELKKLLDEETEKMTLAQAEREEAERVHQAALTEIEKAGTSEQMTDWATAKKFIEENPIFAKTYNITYDETGAPSYTPQVPTVTILPPSLLPVDFSGVGRREGAGSSTAGATVPASTQAATQPATTSPNGGVVIQGDLVVNSPAADASTMMNTTKRTLRNIGTQMVI